MAYENPASVEQWPPLNLLDERVKILLRIDPEAERFFPQVAPEDMESRKEHFAMLLGKFKRVSVDVVVLEILGSGRFDQQEHDKYGGFYREGKEAVEDVRVSKMRKYFEEIAAKDSEFEGWSLIGDMHTHPVLSTEVPHKPWEPSEGDTEGFRGHYENGDIKADEPYIWGIAGPDERGNTQYGFYRLVKREGKYRVIEVVQ